jgi:hypothetical protein
MSFVLLFCCAGQSRAQVPALEVMREANHLIVAAPQLHFLEGKSLEKLHNGASVAYAIEVTVTPDQSGKSIARTRERFIVSFDLWEERFAVIQGGAGGRAGSHFTAAAAEAWCLSNLQIPLPALTPEKTFVIKLECWAEESTGASGDESNSGLTLSGLIDVFSRKGRTAQIRWEAASGLLRLNEIKGKKSESLPPRSEKSGAARRLHLIRGGRGGP